jgi:hypothetical protein
MSLDIAKNGLIHPIVIFENKILEGRNRDRACEMAGVKPTYEQYTGSDPRGYVISVNAMRRDLTKGQRACVAQELATAPEGNPNRNSPNSASYELTMDETAEKMGVGLTSVKDARAIFKADLRVYEQVKNGLITLNQGTIKSGVKKKASKATIKKANVDSLPAIVDPAIFEGLMKTGQFTREQAISVAVKNAPGPPVPFSPTACGTLLLSTPAVSIPAPVSFSASSGTFDPVLPGAILIGIHPSCSVQFLPAPC